MKGNNRLFFYFAPKYLPSAVLDYFIVKKWIKSESEGYVTFNPKDIFEPLRLLLRSRCYFESRLYAMNKSALHVGDFLCAFISGFFLSINLFFCVLKKTTETESEKAFFSTLLKWHHDQIHLGDCILSEVLRDDKSCGYLRLDRSFIFSLFKFIFLYGFVSQFVKAVANKYSGNKYFYIPDTTYVYEAIRRLLLNIGFIEVRYSPEDGRVVELPALLGSDINKISSRRLDFYVNDNDLQEGKDYLHALVYRKASYWYMQGGDIDLSVKLHPSVRSLFDGDKVFVVFMHQVSDAQYFYGIDCFIDLNDWLFKTIDLLSGFNVKVIIKIHPSFFNAKLYYPADKKYLMYLEQEFGVLFDGMLSEKLLATNRKNVFFIHHSVSQVELSNAFPEYICLTHHGTVAIESAYLGHHVVCSTASPYIGLDLFVRTYSTIEEYVACLSASLSEPAHFNESFLNSLYSYVYFRYCYCRDSVDAFSSLGKILGIDRSNYTLSAYNSILAHKLSEIQSSDPLVDEIAEMSQKALFGDI